MTNARGGDHVPRLPLVKTRIERDVEDEIRFHLDARAEELMMAGVPPEQARRQASDEYGSVAESRRELTAVDRRRVRRSGIAMFWLTFWQDVGYSARSLRRQPGFVAVVSLTLALGIGGTAIMFGVVDRLLLRAPAHVRDSDRIVRLYELAAGRGPEATPSYGTTFPLVDALQSEVRAFADVGGYFRGTYSLGRGVDAISPDVMLATGNYFSMLGVRPARGRLFSSADDQNGDGSRVVVLAFGFWRRHFAGAEDVVGRSIILDNKSFTVIGVAAQGFNGVDLQKVDLWIPVHALAADNFGPNWRTGPYAYWIKPIAKLRDGVSVARAEQEATLVAQRTIKSWRSWQDTLTVIMAGPITAAGGPGQSSIEARVSVALVGVTAVVLLIACANVANLLLARAVQRRRDRAMRLALGASRHRLARQALSETILLCGISAALGLMVAWWGGELVRSVLLPEVSWEAAPVDGRVVFVALAAAAVTCLLAGIIPAIRSGRMDPSELLREDARAGGGRTSHLRNGLVVAQAALSMVLLIGAALFIRSLHSVRQVDIGLDADRAWLATTDLRRAGFDEGQARRHFQDAIPRVASIPGVERVSLAVGSVPFRVGNSVSMRRRDQPEPRITRGPYLSAIDSDYFGVLGATIQDGRTFTDHEVRSGAPLVVVNAALATALWPEGGGVGSCVLLDRETDCVMVVGIVETIAFRGVLGDPTPMVYIPLNHERAKVLAINGLLIRVVDGAAPAINLVRRAMQELAPNLPFVDVRSFATIIAPDFRPWILGASMFTIFGILAVVIAVVGLYSVLAYLVTQRRREIGIRMALGADKRQVLFMVLGSGLRLVLSGVAVGALLAIWLGQWAQPLLFGVNARDPFTILVVGGAFAVVSAAACLIPGSRATRVDPALPLRAE
jgi:predicted permease